MDAFNTSRFLKLEGGGEISFTDVMERARQRWESQPIHATFEGRWYYISDIEFGPDILFQAPELLGCDAVMIVSDQIVDGRPGAYFVRFIARPGSERPHERWIDSVFSLEGMLEQATACPYPFFPNQDDSPLQEAELARLCWAVQLIVQRLGGRPVHQVLHLGMERSQSFSSS